MGDTQNQRREQLSKGRQWHLCSPLEIPQFTSAGPDQLICSELNISIEFYFEASDFVVLRNEEAPKAKIQMTDCKLLMNCNVVPANIPCQLEQKLPFQQMDLLTWTATATSIESSSGSYHLENTPNRYLTIE